MINIGIKNKEFIKSINNHLLNLKYKRVLSRQNDENNLLKAQIISEIQKAQGALLFANDNFDYVTDKQLLTMHIYEIKAAEEKLQYLMKVARNHNIEIPLTIKKIC